MPEELWLRLYVEGDPGPQARLQGVLDELGVPCRLEVIDLRREPLRAMQDGVLTAPTLLRLSPSPIVGLIGDLSDNALLRRTLCPEDP